MTDGLLVERVREILADAGGVRLSPAGSVHSFRVRYRALEAPDRLMTVNANGIVDWESVAYVMEPLVDGAPWRTVIALASLRDLPRREEIVGARINLIGATLLEQLEDWERRVADGESSDWSVGLMRESHARMARRLLADPVRDLLAPSVVSGLTVLVATTPNV